MLQNLLQTTFVQRCLHDAINEWYRLLIQFVMFGEFNDNFFFCNLTIPFN